MTDTKSRQTASTFVHGYHHLLPDPGSPEIRDELEQGFDALKRVLGVVPPGFRAPSGESRDELRTALAHRGMIYSSSWRGDVRPYRQVLSDGTPGVIELTVTWAMVTTVLHPQVSGRPMRLRPSRDFLTHAMAKDGLWIATGQEIAAHFAAHEQSALKAA